VKVKKQNGAERLLRTDKMFYKNREQRKIKLRNYPRDGIHLNAETVCVVDNSSVDVRFIRVITLILYRVISC
jgi:hypothetical protein